MLAFCRRNEPKTLIHFFLTDKSSGALLTICLCVGIVRHCVESLQGGKSVPSPAEARGQSTAMEECCLVVSHCNYSCGLYSLPHHSSEIAYFRLHFVLRSTSVLHTSYCFCLHFDLRSTSILHTSYCFRLHFDLRSTSALYTSYCFCLNFNLRSTSILHTSYCFCLHFNLRSTSILHTVFVCTLT